MGKFEILWELPKRDTNTNWVSAVEKPALVDRLDEELSQILHLSFKNAIFAKHNITKYVCTFIAIYTS